MAEVNEVKLCTPGQADVGACGASERRARMTESGTLIGLTVITNDEEAHRWCADWETIRLFSMFYVLDARERREVSTHSHLHGARRVSVPLRPTGEQSVYELVPSLPQSWVFRIDPDEFVTEELVTAVTRAVRAIPVDTVLALPFLYYVGERPLAAGVWGGRRMIARVAHTSNIGPAVVHGGFAGPRRSLDEFALVPPIQHRWISDRSDLRNKHARYLTLEGGSRLRSRGAWSWESGLSELARTFVSVIFVRRPWRDGTLGWLLAYDFLKYQVKANVAWRRASAEASCRGVNGNA